MTHLKSTGANKHKAYAIVRRLHAVEQVKICIFSRLLCAFLDLFVFALEACTERTRIAAYYDGCTKRPIISETNPRVKRAGLYVGYAYIEISSTTCAVC